MGLTIRSDLYISEKNFKYVDNCQEDYKVIVVSELKKRKVEECPADTITKRIRYKTNSQQEAVGEKYRTDMKKSSYNSGSKLDKIECKRYSNTMMDAVKTSCKVCNTHFTLSKMGKHTKKTHFLALPKYIEIYGQLDILEAVYHKCGLCSEVLMIDNNIIVSHLKKKHTVPVDVYYAQFMTTAFKEQEEKYENKKVGGEKLFGLVSAEEIQNMNTAKLMSLFDQIIELI